MFTLVQAAGPNKNHFFQGASGVSEKSERMTEKGWSRGMLTFLRFSMMAQQPTHLHVAVLFFTAIGAQERMHGLCSLGPNMQKRTVRYEHRRATSIGQRPHFLIVAKFL